MVPQTQKALLVTELGKPLILVTDHPVPQPGPGQVLIRVTVAGPNPHDHKARDTGLFIKDSLPAILTNDVVGEVVALGSGVTKYSPGDHIVGQPGFAPGSTQNGFQEYAVLDVNFTAKIPEGFTDDDGATLPTNIIAPLVALFDSSGLDIPAPWTAEAKTFDHKNTTLLVLGGDSNCGRFGVQLAALAGIGRIVVVGGDEAELKSYGATDTIDRHGSPEEVSARIREIVGDDLLYTYDAINPPATQFIGINALSSTKRGRFARLLPFPLGEAEAQIKPKKEGYVLCNPFGSSHVNPELCKPFWERVPDILLKRRSSRLSIRLSRGWMWTR
ncbi:putative alcohol dehydrogenase [Exophiala viscosa]|uniref:Alcohol dehydrogenase n=1 Tax=Exophiala viscosa TaxID=2486360 RepID=A0AAN6IJ06_9EURO|nr:putative alcohol dehydrogenase [Exophiala viscosa]KAI1628103.1 putative alcohol dehydrogenase [Exophiala viscosa]